MTAKPYFVCTAIPLGPVTIDGKADISVLITPMVRWKAGGKRQKHVLLEELPLVSNWPDSSGLPGAPKVTFKVQCGSLLVDNVEIYGTQTKPEVAPELWRNIFDGAHVIPLEPDTKGSTEISPRSFAKESTESLAAAAEAQQANMSTVEGIGSRDLLKNVVVPLLKARLLEDDKLLPADEVLDRYQFALERMDRLGSAGRSSGATRRKTQENAATEKQEEEGTVKEFHEVLSVVGDDRTLMRELGLTVTLTFPLPKSLRKDGASFNLRVSMILGGDEYAEGKATPCRCTANASGGIFCHVDCDDSGDVDSLIGIGYLRANQLDTMQADPLSVLRAALRDREEHRKLLEDAAWRSSADPSIGPQQVAERRVPSLLGHGITIFRREGEMFLKDARQSLGNQEEALGESDTWKAEQLVRGYVVDVRAIPPGTDTAKQEWVSLCARTVKHSLVCKAEEPLWESSIEDESCIGVSASEGATPLSGFLMGPVALKRTFSPEDAKDLGYPSPLKPVDPVHAYYPGHIGSTLHHFLIQTPGGMILVADVPPLGVTADSPKLGPIASRLQEMSRAVPPRVLRKGTWVDLSGVSSSSGRFFLATGAKFEDEFSGVCGIVKPSVQERMALPGVPETSVSVMHDPASGLSCLLMERGDLAWDGMKPVTATAENVQSSSGHTLVVFQHDPWKTPDKPPLMTWLEQHLTAAGAQEKCVLGSARGAAVMALASTGDIILDQELKLEFTGIISGRTLGFRPVTIREGRDEMEIGDPLPVTLELAAKPDEIRTLTEENPAPEELVVGSIFRVWLKSVQFKAPDFQIKAMHEISRLRRGILRGISRKDGKQQVAFDISGQVMTYSVNAETTSVEVGDLIMEPVVEQTSGGPPAEALPVREDGGVNAAPPTAAGAKMSTHIFRSLRGTWGEHGHRLAAGDLCDVEMVHGDGKEMLISVIKVIARDSALCQLGWLGTELKGDKAPSYAEREDVLMFTPMPVVKTGRTGPLPPEPAPAPEAVVVDDRSVMVAGAPFPGGVWRTRQMPPDGKAPMSGGSLVRVFFHDPVPGETMRAVARVEMIHSLRGWLSESGDRLNLKLRGFGTQVLLSAVSGPYTGVSWKQFTDWMGDKQDDSSEVEVMVTETGAIGEIRFQKFAILRKGTDRSLEIHTGRGEIGKMAVASSHPNEQLDHWALFEFRLQYPVGRREDISSHRLDVRYLRRPSMSAEVQLKSGGIKRSDFTADMRVLYNPEDYYVRAEGRDRRLFLLPPIWSVIARSDEESTKLNFLECLAKSQIPFQVRATPGVWVDERRGSRSETGTIQTRQWWSFQAPPQLNRLRFRKVFSEPATSLISGRFATDSHSANHKGEVDAWWITGWSLEKTKALLPELDGFAAEIDIGGQNSLKDPNDSAVPDSGDPNTGRQDLLPDQMILDDALVHWFGGSLAKGEGRRSSLESLDDESHCGRKDKDRLTVTVDYPRKELVPLRIGWHYDFRLRAVWITGDAVPFAAQGPAPENAILHFKPFGEMSAGEGFRRVEAFAGPRIGWVHEGNEKDGVPGAAGIVSAPDVSFREQERQFEFMANSESQFVPPRLARQKVTLKKDTWSASPGDLLIRTDVVATGGAGPLNRPHIVIRPPEIAAREAERLGCFEKWVRATKGHTLYWDVLWAYDEVEISDAWWVFSEDPAKFKRPAATAGRLLHRLPDPDALSLSLELKREVAPGVWEVIPGSFLDLAGVRGFFEKAVWPACTEIRLRIESEKTVTGDHPYISVRDAVAVVSKAVPPKGGNGTQAVGQPARPKEIVVHLPRDADWRLELRSSPAKDLLDRHALRLIRLGESTMLERNAVLLAATNVRLRHATNQPSHAPRKIWMKLEPRQPGDLEIILRGRYEIDRASTGMVLLQCAVEKFFNDDSAFPLPQLPANELSRLLVDSQGRERSWIEAPDGMVHGRSSDLARTLTDAEFAVTELEPMEKDVPAFGPGYQDLRFKHVLGNFRHQRVYYRAVAVSRWASIFDEQGTPGNRVAAYTNPKQEMMSRDEAFKLEKAALEQAANDPAFGDPWGWYRVDIPSSQAPAPPVIPSDRLRLAFAWDPQPVPEESGRWGRIGARNWSFRRTRVPGCRIWLARPWFTSGPDEKLAVVCLGETRVRSKEKEALLNVVSRWAVDGAGTMYQGDGKLRGAGLLTLASIMSAEPDSRGDIEISCAPISGGQPDEDSSLPLPGDLSETRIGFSPGSVRAALAVHTPRFHVGEKLWYCDVFIKATVYQPFVWLALARYQPYSTKGAEISSILKPHPFQIMPERALEIDIAAEAGGLKARVTLTGIITGAIARKVVCRLQACDPNQGWIETEIHESGPADPAEPFHRGTGIPDMGAGGEFWQAQRFRGVDSGDDIEQELEQIDAKRGIFQGAFWIEHRHLKGRAERKLRLSVEEIQLIPAAHGTTSRGPAYFDQVELPEDMLSAIGSEDFLQPAYGDGLPLPPFQK